MILYRKLLPNENLECYKKKIEQLIMESLKSNFTITQQAAKQYAVSKTQALCQYVADESAHAYIACMDEILIGFAWYYKRSVFNEQRLHLDEIVVDGSYRGVHVGSTLLGYGEQLAKELGNIRMELNASECNSAALAFYEACGFHTERRLLCKDFRA